MDQGLPWWLSCKESACQCRRREFSPWVRMSDPLEKEMATHSSILTWKISWTEEPGMLHEVSKGQISLNNNTDGPKAVTFPFFFFVLFYQ